MTATTSNTLGWMDQGYLASGLAATDTQITVLPIIKYPSGIQTSQGFNTTRGVALISQNGIFERVFLDGYSVNATTNITTYSTCTRGLSQTATSANYTGGTGLPWAKGASIQIIVDNSNLDDAMYQSLDNILATGKHLYLGDTGNYIMGVAGGDITLKSNVQSAVPLATLAAAAGADEKVKVSATDTTQGYLLGKIPNPSNGGIVMTQTNGGSDETLVPSINLDTNPGLTISSNKIKALVKANAGLTLDSNGLSIATQGAAGTVLTSTGATSAPTFQTPTTYPLILQTNATEVTVASGTTAEQTLLTKNITGGTLAVGDMLRIEGFLNVRTSSSSQTMSVKLKFGTTALLTLSIPNSANGTGFFWALVGTQAIGSSGKLEAGMFMNWQTAGANVTGVTATIGSDSPVTVDTTATQALSITAQSSGTDSSDGLASGAWTITKIYAA